MGVHFEAQNPITGESLPLTGREMLYGLNINTGEKFEQSLAWLLDQINDERINDGEEYWYFSPKGRDLAWEELKDDGFFEAESDYVCQCGSHELRYVEYDNPEGNGFFCMNCGHSPCGINETDNEPCTCDLMQYAKYTWLGELPRTQFPSYIDVEAFKKQEQDKENERIRIVGSKKKLDAIRKSAETSSDLDCSYCGISGEEREGEPLCSRCLGCFECCETLFDEGQHETFETDWERGEYDPTADVVDITADPIRNRVYVTVRFYTKGGLSSHDVIYTGDLKHSGAADLVLDSESYINPITGQPNFVLISEHIRDGEYERYEYFVIDAESEAKMSDKEILEWQYGEGSVDESGYGDNEFWVHGERLHEIEAQPISLSDALVLERLRIASRNYPYQDLKKE